MARKMVYPKTSLDYSGIKDILAMNKVEQIKEFKLIHRYLLNILKNDMPSLN